MMCCNYIKTLNGLQNLRFCAAVATLFANSEHEKFLRASFFTCIIAQKQSDIKRLASKISASNPAEHITNIRFTCHFAKKVI